MFPKSPAHERRSYSTCQLLASNMTSSSIEHIYCTCRPLSIGAPFVAGGGTIDGSAAAAHPTRRTSAYYVRLYRTRCLVRQALLGTLYPCGRALWAPCEEELGGRGGTGYTHVAGRANSGTLTTKHTCKEQLTPPYDPGDQAGGDVEEGPAPEGDRGCSPGERRGRAWEP